MALGNRLFYARSALNGHAWSGRHDGIAVCFDLRGFTKWSETTSNNPAPLALQLDSTIQRVFQADPVLFVKGTGDGAILALSPASLDHVESVVGKCCEVVASFTQHLAANDLDSKLAIGCGIAYGEMVSIVLFGRTDLLGNCINEASKLQQLAYNEVVVATELESSLGRFHPKASRLATKGWRVQAT